MSATDALQKQLDQVEYLRERIATHTINVLESRSLYERARLARLLDTDERELAHLVAHLERELAEPVEKPTDWSKLMHPRAESTLVSKRLWEQAPAASSSSAPTQMEDAERRRTQEWKAPQSLDYQRARARMLVDATPPSAGIGDAAPVQPPADAPFDAYQRWLRASQTTEQRILAARTAQQKHT
ncbi:MAG: hypothetical protein Q7V62_03670 [Actinomycetota bacterium]|nr:hypothetical protein [Actinomycetota bacterium]